jgi:hypothetical protein
VIDSRVLLVAATAIIQSSGYAHSAYVEVPTTKDWFRLVRDDSSASDSHVIFRRYSVLLNTDVNGAPTLTDFRNTMTYNCAVGKNDTSYLTYYVPREIDLKSILGKDHLTGYEMRVDLTDGSKITVSGEIVENEVFIDHVSSNSSFFKQLELHESYILWFNENFGAMYAEMDDVKRKWISEEEITFDGVIERQLKQNLSISETESRDTKGNSKGSVQVVSTDELFELCR